jgi:DNA-binding GntR family transcriptional regulator
VDLPQPDAPTRQCVSPGLIVKPTPSTAFTVAAERENSPRLSAKCFFRPATSMTRVMIAERIFMAIAGGEFAPGERIREEALADEFEVSRGPVREALRILEKDSVVRILPNRGSHVTQLSVKEVSDIFEVRRTLFGAMIGRLTVQEASALAAILDADIRALDAPAQDPDSGPAYFETPFRLSRIVRDACSNDRMAEILGSLARQTLRYSRLGLATPARRKGTRSDAYAVISKA